MYISLSPTPDKLAYLRRYPMLSHDEEVELGQQVRQMLDGPTPPAVVKRGLSAKRRMIEGNLRLVVYIARKYQGRGLEMEDLISEGILGLNRAVEKFDPARGCRFSTYSCWWIRQAISRALAHQSQTIRLPMHIVDKLNRVKRWKQIYFNEHQRFPNPAELEAFLQQQVGLSLEDFQRLVLLTQRSPSLDATLSRDPEDASACLGQTLQDPRSNRGLEVLEGRYAIDAILDQAQLSDRERRVLKLHFSQGKSLSDIGQHHLGGITRERVRQIKSQALKKCRATIDSTP